MKATLLACLILIVSLTALAQGKVAVVNDSASLVVLTTDTAKLFPADRGLAGQAVGNSVPLPSGVVLMVGLYGGTSSSSLFYYPPSFPSSALLNNAGSLAGIINPILLVLNANAATGAPAIPGIASGTPIGAATPWFQVRIWDSSYASYAAAVAAGSAYVMQGLEFQLNPGPSLAYTFTAPAGPNSTWVDVPFGVPEPSTPSLISLGAAVLLIFRRCK